MLFASGIPERYAAHFGFLAKLHCVFYLCTGIVHVLLSICKDLIPESGPNDHFGYKISTVILSLFFLINVIINLIVRYHLFSIWNHLMINIKESVFVYFGIIPLGCLTGAYFVIAGWHYIDMKDYVHVIYFIGQFLFLNSALVVIRDYGTLIFDKEEEDSMNISYSRYNISMTIIGSMIMAMYNLSALLTVSFQKTLGKSYNFSYVQTTQNSTIGRVWQISTPNIMPCIVCLCLLIVGYLINRFKDINDDKSEQDGQQTIEIFENQDVNLSVFVVTYSITLVCIAFLTLFLNLLSNPLHQALLRLAGLTVNHISSTVACFFLLYEMRTVERKKNKQTESTVRFYIQVGLFGELLYVIESALSIYYDMSTDETRESGKFAMKRILNYSTNVRNMLYVICIITQAVAIDVSFNRNWRHLLQTRKSKFANIFFIILVCNITNVTVAMYTYPATKYQFSKEYAIEWTERTILDLARGLSFVYFLSICIYVGSKIKDIIYE